MNKETIEVSGIWLRQNGSDVTVLAEIDGQFRKVICEKSYGPNESTISHIVEPNGMKKAPVDDL